VPILLVFTISPWYSQSTANYYNQYAQLLETLSPYKSSTTHKKTLLLQVVPDYGPHSLACVYSSYTSKRL
jgi:hypothetical protein